MLLRATYLRTIGFRLALLLPAMVCSLCPLAAAATSDVDVSTAISGYVRNVDWGDRFAVFGTSDFKMEDMSTQSQQRIKSDFKSYRDGDKIEYRAEVAIYDAQGKQTINSTDEERRLVIPGIATLESNEVGRAPDSIYIFRTNEQIKSSFDALSHDENCGGFLEGELFDWKSGLMQMPELFNASKAQVKIRQEMSNGQACCILELDGAADHYAAWLVPDMDYACVRYELSHQKIDRFKDRHGQPYKSYERHCEMSNFRQIEGRWIAMSGRNLITIVCADGAVIKNTLSVERHNVMFDPDFGKLGAFAINIPDGTRVRFSEADLASSVQFEWRQGKIVPRVDEDSLRKAMNNLLIAGPIDEAGTGNWTNAGPWAVAIGIGAVILILAKIGFAKNKDVANQKSAVVR